MVDGDFFMSEKQYYCDDLLEYRDYAIFDLSKADKNIEDFKDEDGDILVWQFDNYLVDETDSMMSREDVCSILNELDKENRKLKNELNLSKLNLKENNEGFDKLHKMYMGQIEENKQLKKDIEDILGMPYEEYY